MTKYEPDKTTVIRTTCSTTEDTLVGPNDSNPWNTPRHVDINGTTITANATIRMIFVISA